jgi:acyl-CoA dehydrogenase
MVNFQPTEEQQLIRDTVASFAQEQIRPLAREVDETGKIPDSIVQHAWDLGLVQSTIPVACGGLGESTSALTGTLIYEELGWGDLSIALHILAPRLITQPLVALGTVEQQQRILPTYTAAKFTAGAAALMEPRFAFDINSLATTAIQQNGDFIVTGDKCLVPLAVDAHHILIYAHGTDGINAFIASHGTPGLVIAEREQNMGLKGLATYAVKLEECRLPATNRLCGDLSALMNRSRVALAALATGVAKAAFEYARDYAKERHAFGTAIAQKQAIAFMLADMAIDIDASRLLTWEAAWMLDQNRVVTREACLAKQYTADIALKITDNAVQILGGHGYIRDHPVELWLRNGRGFATFEGLAMV